MTSVVDTVVYRVHITTPRGVGFPEARVVRVSGANDSNHSSIAVDILPTHLEKNEGDARKGNLHSGGDDNVIENETFSNEKHDLHASSPHGAPIHYFEPSKPSYCPMSTRTTFTFTKNEEKERKSNHPLSTSSTNGNEFFDDLSWPRNLKELDSFHEGYRKEEIAVNSKKEKLPEGAHDDEDDTCGVMKGLTAVTPRHTFRFCEKKRNVTLVSPQSSSSMKKLTPRQRLRSSVKVITSLHRMKLDSKKGNVGLHNEAEDEFDGVCIQCFSSSESTSGVQIIPVSEDERAKRIKIGKGNYSNFKETENPGEIEERVRTMTLTASDDEADDEDRNNGDENERDFKIVRIDHKDYHTEKMKNTEEDTGKEGDNEGRDDGSANEGDKFSVDFSFDVILPVSSSAMQLNRTKSNKADREDIIVRVVLPPHLIDRRLVRRRRGQAEQENKVKLFLLFFFFFFAPSSLAFTVRSGSGFLKGSVPVQMMRQQHQVQQTSDVTLGSVGDFANIYNHEPLLDWGISLPDIPNDLFEKISDTTKRAKVLHRFASIRAVPIKADIEQASGTSLLH